MFINSHLATGYLLYKLNIFEKKWLPIWILSAWIPDIDGLWSSSVVEHHSVLHTQIFWIVVCSLGWFIGCLLYTSPSPRDATLSRMPSSA